MRSNQETLGNGCVCETGCDSCDRLAEAWEAMLWALRRCAESALIDAERQAPDVHKEIRAALRLAEKVRQP